MDAGLIYLFAGNTVPEGFLECDGSAISRSSYSSLFDAIGTLYGVGDGSTTFNIPDLSGRLAIGTSLTHALGSTGGEETCTLVSDELPSHNHSVGAHTHGNDIAVSTPALSHSITQPAYKYNKPGSSVNIKKSNPASARARSGTATGTATRSTSVSVAAHAATACTMSGGVTDADPFDSGTAGLGSAHNNMQPFITMKYIISIGD